jgi:hypothetical protein
MKSTEFFYQFKDYVLIRYENKLNFLSTFFLDIQNILDSALDARRWRIVDIAGVRNPVRSCWAGRAWKTAGPGVTMKVRSKPIQDLTALTICLLTCKVEYRDITRWRLTAGVQWRVGCLPWSVCASLPTTSESPVGDVVALLILPLESKVI